MGTFLQLIMDRNVLQHLPKIKHTCFHINAACSTPGMADTSHFGMHPRPRTAHATDHGGRNTCRRAKLLNNRTMKARLMAFKANKCVADRDAALGSSAAPPTLFSLRSLSAASNAAASIAVERNIQVSFM